MGETLRTFLLSYHSSQTLPDPLLGVIDLGAVRVLELIHTFDGSYLIPER